MTRSHVAEVKRERRKSLFFREITTLVQEVASKEVLIADVYVSHVDISSNSGICYVYLSSFKEPCESIVMQAINVLKLYKPSMRKEFASRVQTRYAPDLVFVYDKAKEKERRINELLAKVHDDLEQSEQKEK